MQPVIHFVRGSNIHTYILINNKHVGNILCASHGLQNIRNIPLICCSNKPILFSKITVTE